MHLSQIFKAVAIVAFIMQFFVANGQSDVLKKEITILIESMKLKDALKVIESEAGARFAYNENTVGMAGSVQLDAEELSIEKILDKLLEKTHLNYRMVGGIVTIYDEKEESFFELKSETRSGKYTISGTVNDAETGEALIGVNIYNAQTFTGTSSNAYGYYSVTLEVGTYQMVASYSGYQNFSEVIEISADITRNIELQSNSVELETVVILAEEVPTGTVEVSTVKFTSKKVAVIPAILGEPDMQQAILSTAGVSSVGEGTTGFNVRGGKTDQNLILVDEAPLYNTAHLFGFISVINNDAVKDFKFYKAGIPAKYGGRTSSVIDIRLREGNSRKFEGALSINPISSKIGLEVPIIKDKLNVYFSGRKSFLDLFMRLPKDPSEEGQKLNFHDATLKLNYKVGEKDRLFLSGYSGADRMDQQYQSNSRNIKDTFGWGDRLATLRWNHIFSKNVFSNLTLLTGNYKFDYSTDYDDASGKPASGRSGVKTQEGKFDISFFPDPKIDIHVGFGAKNNIFTKLHQRSESSSHLPPPRSYGLEYYGYVDIENTLLKNLALHTGLRYSGMWTYGPEFINIYDPSRPPEENTVTDVKRVRANETVSNYHNPEPRISLAYYVNKKNILKVAYDRMVQYVHLLSSSNAVVPFDSWSPVNYHLLPTISDQYTIGYTRIQNDLSISVDLFGKKMKHFLEFRENAQILLQDPAEVLTVPASLEAYGIELTIEKSTKRMDWSANYTWSRSFVKTVSQWDEIQINDGKAFPSNYDRPHNVNLLVSWNISHRVKLNSKFMYQSGRPVTLPEGRINNLIIYSERNSFRLPVNHRLDLAISIKQKPKEGRKINGELIFSILNFYSRKNTFSYFIAKRRTSINTPYDLKKVSILGSMIPSFAYNITF